MYLGTQTWPDVEAALESAAVAVVPLGSTEQHGPHLPLSTDHVIAESLARAAAERACEADDTSDVVCTPTVNVGVSDHHRQFPGTMWVDPPAFREYVAGLTRSLSYHGLDRIVYVNAHGGNVQHLTEVARDLRRERVAYATAWMWDDAIPGLVDDLFDTNGPHAGPKETSLLLHLAPESVDESAFVDARDGGCTDVAAAGHYREGARVHYDAVENSPNGAFGDPTDATAEKGADLFEAATDALVRLTEWLAAQEFEALMPREPVRTGGSDP